MRASSSAGRGPALVFLLALSLALAGCGSASDTAAITALVDRFMALLARTAEPAGAADIAEDLEGVFFGLDAAGAPSPLEGLAPLSPEASWTIRGVSYVPFDGATVTVDLANGETTTTLEMRAKKLGEAWKLEPSFRVRQRLGEVRIPGS